MDTEKKKQTAMLDREKVRAEFADYVSDFDAADGKIKLKIDHTYRVAAICDRIADSLSLTGEEKEIAWLLGMLHDIGRFKQVREYGTFIDADSVDHALLSTQVLFEEGYIRRFLDTDAYDEIIFTAIRHHNAYRLPGELEGEMLILCNLIRDADKVDILRVNVETPFTVIYGPQAADMKQEIITEQVMEDYRARHCVLRAHNKNMIDHVAGHASLVFELVYPISLQIAREQGYLDQLLAFQSENEKTQEQFRLLRQIMDDYMEGEGC